ncbi:MAG TPA: GNAT family protein, partial [Anaerolineales bacterium]|nr:GNAT family protein [Anaerolineales bacterium]
LDPTLRLHPFHPDDTAPLFALLEHNRARLRPWLNPYTLPETYEAARKYTIESFFNALGDPMKAFFEYADYFRELGQYFPATHPALEMGIWQNDDLIGMVSMRWLPDSTTALEFGYWITEEKEGQGIITQRVEALMNDACANTDVTRFVIGCARENTRSRAVPEQLGYRVYVTVPQGEKVGEFAYDRVVYGMKAKDWRMRHVAPASPL